MGEEDAPRTYLLLGLFSVGYREPRPGSGRRRLQLGNICHRWWWLLLLAHRDYEIISSKACIRARELLEEETKLVELNRLVRPRRSLRCAKSHNLMTLGT